MMSFKGFKEKFTKEIEHRIKKCYGAISNLQNQIHSLVGHIENVSLLLEEATSDIDYIKQIIKEGVKFSI